MKKNLFDYHDYKRLLADLTDEKGKGARSKLAAHLGCQSGFVTHVLNGAAHFSLEQADLAAQFFHLPDAERQFLLLLVSANRAGTPSLKRHFEKQIEQAHEARQNLKNRIKFQKTLSVEEQSIFYSSWQYGAVHVAVSIPGCDTADGLSKYLGIPLSRIVEITEFLLSIQVIQRESGKFTIGTSQIYLGADSPLISKHHTNWRIKSIQSLDEPRESDLHYSSVISVSHQDAAKIREMMIRYIEEIRAVVRPSRDETCYSYSFDLISLECKPT